MKEREAHVIVWSRLGQEPWGLGACYKYTEYISDNSRDHGWQNPFSILSAFYHWISSH